MPHLLELGPPARQYGLSSFLSTGVAFVGSSKFVFTGHKHRIWCRSAGGEAALALSPSVSWHMNSQSRNAAVLHGVTGEEYRKSVDAEDLPRATCKLRMISSLLFQRALIPYWFHGYYVALQHDCLITSQLGPGD